MSKKSSLKIPKISVESTQLFPNRDGEEGCPKNKFSDIHNDQIILPLDGDQALGSSLLATGLRGTLTYEVGGLSTLI